MDEQAIVEIVNAQADGLVNDTDLTAELLALEPVAGRATVEPLLTLARAVDDALPPVEPRPEFVAELKGELRAHARLLREQIEGRQQRAIWLAAGLGGLVYFVGMTLVGLRLSWAALSFIAGLLGWKMTRRPASKTRVAHS
jgi:hypothetical protein